MKFNIFITALVIGMMLGQHLPKTFFRYWYDDVTIEEGDHVKIKKNADDLNEKCNIIVKSMQATDSGNQVWLVFSCGKDNQQVFTMTAQLDTLYRVYGANKK